ncbi:zinc metalloproteinase nas-15-like [Stylophora pistillata]|uniref:zinc metalloproteinase nas-15-like n=1 Tax=Stylophora pistillata TaxID=50429 RepID=UPI000C0442DE|nr:zinc metalloproteinase nas-15-like [Stylophora pistillata]
MKWLFLLVLCAVAIVQGLKELENPKLFEGDVVLERRQAAAIRMGGFGRAANIGRRWPGGVMVMSVHPSLRRNRRAWRAIRQGMWEWMKKSCINFRGRRRGERAYVNFVPGRGCSSYVGRTGRRQALTLARGCWTRGIVAHEIGHALGLWHEQSRPDRDRYVRILWQNIQPRAKHNFRKLGRKVINSLGFRYDYYSVMHYGPKAFSRNRRPTIVPKRRGVRLRRTPVRVSRIDKEQMKRMYRKPRRCRG